VVALRQIFLANRAPMSSPSIVTLAKYYNNLKLTVGEAMQTQSAAQVARSLQGAVTIKFCEYWGAKYEDPTLHAGTWGGARNVVFSDEDQLVVEVRCSLDACISAC